MTVFITQSPMRRNVHDQLVHKFDLAPARQYGDLQILLPAGPVLLEPMHQIRELRRNLARFTHGDFLLCLGDPVVIAAASAIVSGLTGGLIPLLVWDRHQKSYLSVSVDVA